MENDNNFLEFQNEIDKKLTYELNIIIDNYIDNFLCDREKLESLSLLRKLHSKVTKVLILRVLKITNANTVVSAKILGIGRNTLRQYIKSLAYKEYKDLIYENRVTQDKRRKL